MERVHACWRHDHTRWGRGRAGQPGNRKQNDRQRSLPEHLRERGVAVIRPIGQNSSWVRGRWEESVEDREGGGGAFQEAGGSRGWGAKGEELAGRLCRVHRVGLLVQDSMLTGRAHSKPELWSIFRSLTVMYSQSLCCCNGYFTSQFTRLFDLSCFYSDYQRNETWL